MKLRRTNIGAEVRHELKRHPGLVAVLKVPTNSEMLSWLDGGANQFMETVIHGVLRLEGEHPDAAAFGLPGSAERRAFVDAMDPMDLFEIGSAVDALGRITEDEAKN